MSDKVLEFINNGIFEIEGASDFFFKFKKEYPTYDDIKREYNEATGIKDQIKNLCI
ncbi:hypothetical protein [uncultured Polaribacter sp.]|uniref:hypothetical protein n=1 Tax=uncultured Polaribacter sp. TaxID=174711 RepID=UPI00261C7FD7|nr:hypothetical protein [uncultured Polaribacter sp.]